MGGRSPRLSNTSSTSALARAPFWLPGTLMLRLITLPSQPRRGSWRPRLPAGLLNGLLRWPRERTVARARCSASWGLCSSTHGTDRFGSPNQHQQLHCIAVASASATDIRTSGKTGLPQHDPERSSCWARTSCTLSRHASCAPQPTQRAFFQARPRNFSRKLYCKKSWQNASEIKKICAQGKTRELTSGCKLFG